MSTIRPMLRTLQTALVALAATPPAQADEIPEWVSGAVVYAISVPSFRDSDGDGVGDLRGLLQKLDYLNDGDPTTRTDLGVDAIALLPITDGSTLLGVDPIDFRRVHPALGTVDDLRALVDALHARGVRLILDLSVNHTSYLHPWFQAALVDSADFRDRYVWRDHDPGWTRPHDHTLDAWVAAPDSQYVYAMLWDATPDLDHRHPAVREEIRSVLAYWLDLGVDGFRVLDARHLVETGGGDGQADTPETIELLRELRSFVHERRPHAVVVGEAMTDLPGLVTYLGGEVAPDLMRHRVPPGPASVDVVLDHELFRRLMRGLRQGNAVSVADHLQMAQELLPPGAVPAPFLSHPNLARVAREVNEQRSALQVAVPILLTLPGMPVLYYGDELGMTVNEIRGETSRRSPFPWTAAAPLHGFTTHSHPWVGFATGVEATNVATQTATEGSILAVTRDWIRARTASVALRRGTIRVLSPTEGAARELVFLREHPEETVLVAHDLAARPVSARVPLPDATRLVPLVVGEGVGATLEGGEVVIRLGPNRSGVWQVE